MRIPMRRAPAPLPDFFALLRWIFVLRRLRPDALVIGTPKASLLGILAGRIVGIPIRVYQVRGLRIETTDGFMRSVLERLERLTAASATHILAISPSLATRMVDLTLNAGREITVLGSGSSNGVDLDRFGSVSRERVLGRLSELGVPTEPPLIGFVGRMNDDKGLGILLEAGERMQRAGLSFQLVLVGAREGNGSAVQKLDRMISERVPWVHYIGKQR